MSELLSFIPDATAAESTTKAATDEASTDKTKSSSLDKWKTQAEKTLLDMSASNSDILDFITKAAQDKNFSEAKMQALNFLINLRSQICMMMTNVLRTLQDASDAVIRNIQA